MPIVICRLPGMRESIQTKSFTGSSAWKWKQSSGNLRCAPLGRWPVPWEGWAPCTRLETARALPLHAGAEVWTDGQRGSRSVPAAHAAPVSPSHPANSGMLSTCKTKQLISPAWVPALSRAAALLSGIVPVMASLVSQRN